MYASPEIGTRAILYSGFFCIPSFLHWMIRSGRRFHLCQGTSLKISLPVHREFIPLFTRQENIPGFQDFFSINSMSSKIHSFSNAKIVLWQLWVHWVRSKLYWVLARPLGNTATIMEDGRLKRGLKKTKKIMHLKNSHIWIYMNYENNSRSFCIFICIFAQIKHFPFLDKKHAKHCFSDSGSPKVGGATRPSLLADTGGTPSLLGGGNSKIFFVHPDPWGNWSNLTNMFSNGLVQPPASFFSVMFVPDSTIAKPPKHTSTSSTFYTSQAFQMPNGIL